MDVERRIEEAILVILIAMEFFDFLKILPPDADYIKKILSWSALGYLVYKINLSRLLFGSSENPKCDIRLNIFIILAYFFLIAKNLVAVSISSDGGMIFSDFLSFVGSNALAIETFSLYAGGVLLILISIYIAFFSDVKPPSFLSAINEDTGGKNLFNIIIRFVLSLGVLLFFFIAVFNIMMEWLAVAVDATLAVIIVFFYLFVIIRHYQKLSPDSFLYKIGDTSDNFYQKFMELFLRKETLFLAVSAILVLHLLTDLGNFIIPYLINTKDAIYFQALNPMLHNTFLTLFIESMKQDTVIISKLLMIWVYFFNILAIFFLLTLPAYIWYKLYRKEGFKVSDWMISLFFASLTVFLISPILSMSSINSLDAGIVGVDFTTHAPQNILHAFTASLIIGLIAYMVSRFTNEKEKILMAGIASINIFFAVYIYKFFLSVWNYYINNIILLLRNSYFFIGLLLFSFFVMTIILYVGGFILFMIETIQEFKYIE